MVMGWFSTMVLGPRQCIWSYSQNAFPSFPLLTNEIDTGWREMVRMAHPGTGQQSCRSGRSRSGRRRGPSPGGGPPCTGCTRTCGWRPRGQGRRWGGGLRQFILIPTWEEPFGSSSESWAYWIGADSRTRDVVGPPLGEGPAGSWNTPDPRSWEFSAKVPRNTSRGEKGAGWGDLPRGSTAENPLEPQGGCPGGGGPAIRWVGPAWDTEKKCKKKAQRQLGWDIQVWIEDPKLPNQSIIFWLP